MKAVVPLPEDQTGIRPPQSLPGCCQPTQHGLVRTWDPRCPCGPGQPPQSEAGSEPLHADDELHKETCSGWGCPGPPLDECTDVSEKALALPLSIPDSSLLRVHGLSLICCLWPCWVHILPQACTQASPPSLPPHQTGECRWRWQNHVPKDAAVPLWDL